MKFPVILIIVIAVAMASVISVSLVLRPSEQERLQDHSHYFVKTAPDGTRIPCVTNPQGLSCGFPDAP